VLVLVYSSLRPSPVVRAHGRHATNRPRQSRAAAAPGFVISADPADLFDVTANLLANQLWTARALAQPAKPYE